VKTIVSPRLRIRHESGSLNLEKPAHAGGNRVHCAVGEKDS
jgi:hypothetical protein